MKEKIEIAVDLEKLGIDASKYRPAVHLTGEEPELFDPVPIGTKPLVAERWDGPPVDGHAGKVLKEIPSSDIDYLPPYRAVPIPLGDEYFYDIPLSGNAKVKDNARKPLKRGTFYVVYERGTVFGITKDGDTFVALNFTIEFLKKTLIYEDQENAEAIYTIQVTKSNLKTEEITAKESEYDGLFKIIKKQMPSVFKNANATNATQEYFADCFEDKGKLPVEIKTKFCGWYAFNIGPRYYVGTDSFYKDWIDPYRFNVADTEKASVISKGLGFLRIGNRGTAACLMFLFAHAAFLRFWFERQKIKFRSTLYLVGNSGSLKSAVAAVITNVFDNNESHCASRMSSTKASAKSTLKFLHDTFFLIDDFSNGNKSESAQSEDLRYKITRILADDAAETKMDPAHKTGIAFDSFRSVVMFTAEEMMNVGKSTELRTVTVEVDENTFDGNLLSVYQQTPELMQGYFALFVQYLTKAGALLETGFYSAFENYRHEYSERFPGLRRIADTSAQLHLTADIIGRFAADHGLDISLDVDKMLGAIDEAQQVQLHQVKENEPYKRFVSALFACLLIGKRDADAGIAESEDDYNADSKKFIGYSGSFQGEEALFVRFDPALVLVRSYYKKLEEPFHQKPLTIKKELFRKKIIYGKESAPGSPAEYVVKKSRSPRDSMTVFLMDKVKVFLGERRE